MTGPSQPIATTYVEIRPTPGAKQTFQRDVADTVEPAAKHVQGRIGQAVADGLKTPVGATAAGAAIGTVLGQGIGTGLRTALRGLTAIPRTGFAELKDYQAGLSQLNAGLKSTGGVAGLTANQLEDLASKIQKYSGQTDDSIVRAEGFLLTFDQVRDTLGKGNDVFTRATKASADLAARGFGTAESSAVQLGKALQSPTTGLVGLTRVGVTFTDQQKAQIKALEASGKTLDAQKVILAAVEKQVGGSARAYGETLPGQIDRGKRSFEDISQTIVGATISFVDHNQKTTEALAGVVGAVYIAHKAIRAYQALQETLFAGTAKKVAANAALARSYDGVAASAARAAEAEAVEGGAGRGAGSLVRGGLAVAGRAGVIAGAAVGIYGLTTEGLLRGDEQRALREGAAARGRGGFGFDQGRSRSFGEDLLHRFGSGTIDRLTGYTADQAAFEKAQAAKQQAADQRLATYLATPTGAASASLIAARMAFADPTKRAAEAAALGGVFDSPFAAATDRHPGLADAREAQRRANSAVTAAQVAVRNAQGGSGGATAAQIAAAEATVASRQAAIRRRGGDETAEQLGLVAAEARLSDLRGKGGVNTDKLRAAEERLRAARVTATAAAHDTRKAEEGTALGVKAITDRIGGQLKNAKGLRDDAKTLISDGVSRGVLEELYKLEKEAPGTLDKVAKSLTPAMAKQLNSQYTALQKVQEEFLTAPLRAAVEAAKAEQDRLLTESAKQQAATYAKALKDAGVDLTPKGAPTPTGPGRRPEAPDTGPAPDPTHGPPDPHEHGAPVHLHLTGYNARQVRHVAAQVTRQADRSAAASIGIVG